MPVEMAERTEEKLIEVRLRDRLVKEDYAKFVPVVDQLVRERGGIRLLVVMRDFQGWTAGALWEDVQIDAKRFHEIRRLAVVGDTQWQRGLSLFCRPFTTAGIRYFGPDQIDDARRWLTGNGWDIDDATTDSGFEDSMV